jgi:hypothetical protein
MFARGKFVRMPLVSWFVSSQSFSKSDICLVSLLARRGTHFEDKGSHARAVVGHSNQPIILVGVVKRSNTRASSEIGRLIHPASVQ